MKEMEELYNWIYDLKENRVSYGRTGTKAIHQSDMDKGMRIYLQLKKALNEKHVIIERSYLERLERADDKNWERYE